MHLNRRFSLSFSHPVRNNAGYELSSISNFTLDTLLVPAYTVSANCRDGFDLPGVELVPGRIAALDRSSVIHLIDKMDMAEAFRPQGEASGRGVTAATVEAVSMPVLKRRSRLVTFRVSDDEYHLLATCCINSGARSVAEYARLSVLQTSSASYPGAGTLTGNLASISRALSELDLSLGEARLRIARVLGHVSSDDSGHGEAHAASAGHQS